MGYSNDGERLHWLCSEADSIMIGQFMAAAVAIVGRIRKKKKPGKSRQFSRAGVFAAPWALAESAGAIANVQASEFAHYLPKRQFRLARTEKKRPAIRSQGGIRDFLIGTLKSECEIRKRTPTRSPMQGAGHWRSSVFAIDVGFHDSFRWPGRWLLGGAGS